MPKQTAKRSFMGCSKKAWLTQSWRGCALGHGVRPAQVCVHLCGVCVYAGVVGEAREGRGLLWLYDTMEKALSICPFLSNSAFVLLVWRMVVHFYLESSQGNQDKVAPWAKVLLPASVPPQPVTSYCELNRSVDLALHRPASKDGKTKVALEETLSKSPMKLRGASFTAVPTTSSWS